MDNEIQSIHEFDVNLIVEFYSTVERQGPGSPEITLKALSFIDNLDKNSKIADLGCGTGGQTRVLAEHTQGKITGVDLFPRFVDLFNLKTKEANLHNRVECIVGSMDKLPFQSEEYDLIWSEGAIYNMGFEEGLKEWNKFLKPGGYVAVSEAAWFTDERPKEIEEFWDDAYPGIDTIPNKVQQMQNAGYMAVASFIIPEDCWTKHFYEPMLGPEEEFLAKQKGNKAAEGFIANQRYERDLYYKYKNYYGYVFFIGKKI